MFEPSQKNDFAQLKGTNPWNQSSSKLSTCQGPTFLCLGLPKLPSWNRRCVLPTGVASPWATVSLCSFIKCSSENCREPKVPSVFFWIELLHCHISLHCSVRKDYQSKSVRIPAFKDLLVFLYEVEVYSIDSSKTMGNFPNVLNFNWLLLKLIPRSHQTSSLIPTVSFAGDYCVLRNSCWPTTLYIIIVGDADGWCDQPLNRFICTSRGGHTRSQTPVSKMELGKPR